MISPEEIKKRALSWWEPFLLSSVKEQSFFPKEIERIGKITAKTVVSRYEANQMEVETLFLHSKNKTGKGYFVRTIENNFRKAGINAVPSSIVFDTVEDYLHYTGKKREWETFKRNYRLLIDALPQLAEWIAANVGKLTNEHTSWENIVKVCRYFIQTPRPELYLRQLPIDVDTKFAEQNASLLVPLLDFLIPGHVRDKSASKIDKRYYLKYDEPLVRIRILDQSLIGKQNITDLSVQLSAFEQIDWECRNVIITENKMNFLALPALPKSIAIWSGGGFNVKYLSGAAWLKNKRILYWGDIDEHGFQILHQMRCYFSHTESVMMNIKTYDDFKDYCAMGEQNKSETLGQLDYNEKALYNILKADANKSRLEQEKIHQNYSDDIWKDMLGVGR